MQLIYGPQQNIPVNIIKYVQKSFDHHLKENETRTSKNIHLNFFPQTSLNS